MSAARVCGVCAVGREEKTRGGLMPPALCLLCGFPLKEGRGTWVNTPMGIGLVQTLERLRRDANSDANRRGGEMSDHDYRLLDRLVTIARRR